MNRAEMPVPPGARVTLEELDAKEMLTLFRDIVIALVQRMPGERVDLAEGEIVRAHNASGNFRLEVHPSENGAFIEHIIVAMKEEKTHEQR